ncbi:hypothetical protein U9M48_029359 [Paspalum notatum var. saurae]|uniref:Reverse transcriptase Ty1/copia-type domain-containing protein n=1 Tax=Paspalum notatum var. saurae TaxID=547442 RepID=A0AAQ3X1G3_PASNO
MNDEFRGPPSKQYPDSCSSPAARQHRHRKWIFKHKPRSDGTLDRYKARRVLRGFAGVPALTSTRLYRTRPSGFVDPTAPTTSAGSTSPSTASNKLLGHGTAALPLICSPLALLKPSRIPPSFVFRRGSDTAFPLLYVDDIVLTASTARSPSPDHRRLARLLSHEGSWPPPRLPWDRRCSHTRRDAPLSPPHTLEILERAGMTECKPRKYSVDTRAKLSSTAPRFSTPLSYRRLGRCSTHLTFTRPDITYAVRRVRSTCMIPGNHTSPRSSASCATRAAPSTSAYSRPVLPRLGRRPSTPMPIGQLPDTRRSTSGYAVFLGDCLVSRSASAGLPSLAPAPRPSTAPSPTVLPRLPGSVGFSLSSTSPSRRATVVYCDNVSAVYLSTNPHVEIDLHFVRERVAAGAVRVLHVPTTSQFADIFTKGLPSSVFLEFWSSMNVRSTDVPTAGGC